MTNPVDDYLGMRKHAFFGRPAGKAVETIGQEFVRGGAHGLAAAGALALLGGASKLVTAINKHRDFRGMMENNPDLEEYRAENPKQFTQHYSSFRNMNPGFAADPTVAGAYMRQMSMSPATAGKVIVESMESASRTPQPYSVGLKGLEPSLGMKF